MGYIAMNQTDKLKREFHTEWNEKYSSPIALFFFVLTIIVTNGFVIYSFGVIPELIFSIIIAAIFGVMTCIIIDEILKAIYIKIKIRRKSRIDEKKKEAEIFENFVIGCRRVK